MQDCSLLSTFVSKDNTMRKFLLSVVLFIGAVSVYAHGKAFTNNQNMENKTSTLRLIYPQWQGGIVDHWMPDIPADDASRGYYLGAQLLNFLAPESSQKTWKYRFTGYK